VEAFVANVDDDDDDDDDDNNNNMQPLSTS
jgi:hypothetical protein